MINLNTIKLLISGASFINIILLGHMAYEYEVVGYGVNPVIAATVSLAILVSWIVVMAWLEGEE